MGKGQTSKIGPTWSDKESLFVFRTTLFEYPLYVRSVKNKIGFNQSYKTRYLILNFVNLMLKQRVLSNQSLILKESLPYLNKNKRFRVKRQS